MLMRLMSKGEYLIVPKGTKFKGSGKLGLKLYICRGVSNTHQSKGRFQITGKLGGHLPT